jgi:hypothetical protein
LSIRFRSCSLSMILVSHPLQKADILPVCIFYHRDALSPKMRPGVSIRSSEAGVQHF